MQTAEPESISEQGDDARCAILTAARALAEREGLKSVTLAKVAAEAELPRSLVCGQFARRRDLLNFVAADSVATLARSIGVVDWRSGSAKQGDTHEGAVILALPRRDVASAGNGERAEQDMIDLVSPSGTTGAGAQAEETDQTASANEETDEPDNIPASAPYAWLERRLRVFERAIAEMDERLKLDSMHDRPVAAPKDDATNALQLELNKLTQTWDENFGQIQQRLADLVTRISTSESHHTESLNEVRTSLNDASLRLQTVEGVVQAALVENETLEPDTAAAVPAPTPEEPIVELPSTNETGAVGNVPPRVTSYLTAARASAIAASAIAEAGLAEKTPVLRRNHTLEIAVAIAVLGLSLATGLTFTRSLWSVRHESHNQVARQASPELVAAAADAPLDRLVQNAEAGDANSELAIALRYLNGTGSARDPIAGMRWTTRAAKHGSAVAQFMLGYLYEKGGTVAADPAQAMHWYEAAALQGNRKAMHNLAVGYAQGLGGKKNTSDAVRWFSRAASLGYIDSQFDLAVLYERGDGVPQSLIDAYKWYAIAGAQGDAESKLRIDALRTQLRPDDVAAAQRAADAFRALPFDPRSNVAPALHG